jgi:hypothetical protein
MTGYMGKIHFQIMPREFFIGSEGTRGGGVSSVVIFNVLIFSDWNVQRRGRKCSTCGKETWSCLSWSTDNSGNNKEKL